MKGVTRSKAGRPSHAPSDRNRRTVEVLSGFAIPIERIAYVLNISPGTLQKHYADEILRGAAKVEAKLIGNLLRIAGGSDGTALKAIMFALNCRFGWSAYLPRPADTAPAAPLGKKEAADIEAQTAHENSSWSDLVH